ncbi:MAG TPA: aldo/keto reductase [Burkholderiales bacterium]|nr:aldo/keto reductase [Burkholderiales bacterium]
MVRCEFRSGRRRALGLLAGVPAALALNPAMSAPAPLITRLIPSTGERLPVIGLGTWQTFDVGGDAQARGPLRGVLSAMAEDGAKLIDSSPMYGSSESVVGELVAALGLRPQLFLATKVWTSGRDEGIRQMEQSFRRLRIEQLDLMQIHNLLDAATHTRTLEDWKQAGRVRYIGITHYTSSAYQDVERWLKRGNYDFLQINYSLDEPEAAERLLPLAQEKNAAVIVNRPFGKGSMFRRTRGKPLPGWARELGIASWAQYFLKWIIAHPAVTCAIPGTSNPRHMVDNLGAARGALPDAAMRVRMAQTFDAL